MQKEVEAETALQQGNRDSALMLAKEASDVELTLNAPSGPPDPIKPATEFYAGVLVLSGDMEHGALAFNEELMRTPNRTTSVLGLKAIGYSQVATYAATDGGSKATPDMPHVH